MRAGIISAGDSFIRSAFKFKSKPFNDHFTDRPKDYAQNAWDGGRQVSSCALPASPEKPSMSVTTIEMVPPVGGPLRRFRMSIIF